jgi:alpha/beta hydrolase family protein
MKMKVLPVILSQALFALAVGQAKAQSLAGTVPVPVPQTALIPVTHDSYPFGAADHLNVPEDLSKVGYVEEEYFVSGTANVYDWPPPGTATVRVANAPYTTRMLVRRPIQKERLSGNVIVEILNATNGVDLEIGWALSKDYLVRHGDVWIGFTSKPVTAAALQKFNPTRYAPLNWANPLPLSDPENCTNLVSIIPGDSSRTTENGLLWDIFSQIAAWARSNASIIPIQRTQCVYGYGYSQSGFDVQTYVDAVHPLAKQANGKPIYDGFLIAAGFNSPAPINQCSEPPSGSGAGQIKNAGVPVIRMATNSEALLPSVQAGRRGDSDQPQDRFREYEIAGAAHASQNELDYGPAYADILAAGVAMPPLTAGFGLRSPLNIGIFQNAAFANLDLWVRSNVAPPAGALLSFQNGAPVLDQFGNPTGGVRSPYLDVPTAQWFVSSPGGGLNFLLGYVHPFDEQQLKPLYDGHERYVDAVTNTTRKLVLQHYLTREDGAEIIGHAKDSDVPTLADIPSDLPDDLR